MKNIFITILLLILISLSPTHSHATQICEYNGITTTTENIHNSLFPGETFIHIRDGNLINDLEQLGELTCVQYADFYNSGLTGDLSSLQNMTDIEYLNLHTNPDITGDICSISNATKMRSLKLAFDPKLKGDISCLNRLNLETFAMSFTDISGDISSLSHMTDLKELYLTGSAVSGDISALSGLTNLEQLVLSDTEVHDSRIYGDLSSLDNLQKLKKVSLYNMDVSNCKHFSKTHPNIEQGGCSDESRPSSSESNNLISEIIIGLRKPGQNKAESPDYQKRPNSEFEIDELNVILVISMVGFVGAIVYIFLRKNR